MAETKIEWTHRKHPLTGAIHPGFTFNPWIGCTAVSKACRLCYAKAMDDMRFSRTLGAATPEAPISHFGKGAPRHRTSPDTWKHPRKWNRQAKEAGIALAVFCASLADWADEEVPTEWLVDLLELVKECQNLDWLLLTKRNPKDALTRAHQYLYNLPENTPEQTALFWWLDKWLNGEAPANVWLGATMEEQKTFDQRIEWLLATPAAVRFASMEPLFEAVDISRGLPGGDPFERKPGETVPFCGCEGCNTPRPSATLDWVIVGGESCKEDKAKSWPMHPDDVLNVATQCWAAGVPFFFKQWGDWAPAFALDHNPQAQAMCVLGKVKAHDFARGEAGRRVTYNVGKAAAGHVFEGEIRHEMPPVRLLN